MEKETLYAPQSIINIPIIPNHLKRNKVNTLIQKSKLRMVKDEPRWNVKKDESDQVLID
jgi:hypothetical protein